VRLECALRTLSHTEGHARTVDASIPSSRAVIGGMDVRRGHMMGISGNLQNMRSQLEKIKGEVDRFLALVDEGLKSFGPEEFNNLEKVDFDMVKHRARVQFVLKFRSTT